MCVPPRPFTISCTSCNWQKIVIPKSDALALGSEWFTHCPRCDSDALQKRPATTREQIKAELLERLNTLFP